MKSLTKFDFVLVMGLCLALLASCSKAPDADDNPGTKAASSSDVGTGLNLDAATQERLGLEIVTDVTSKLEKEGVAMFAMLIRRYPDGFLDVTLQCSPIRLTVDEATRIFDTARDKLIAVSVVSEKTKAGSE